MSQIVNTLGDLLEILKGLSPEQLKQSAQVIISVSDDSEVQQGHPVVCVGTVDGLGLRYVRSSRDNRRHGDEVVIYVDSNPYGEDGVIAYESVENDWSGAEEFIPIYSKNHSEDQDWTGPAQILADEELKNKAREKCGQKCKKCSCGKTNRLDEVTLWPPDPEKENWTVIVTESNKEVRTEFMDKWDFESGSWDNNHGYEAAKAFALAEADRLGVVAYVPDNDGDMRKL